MSDLKRNLAKLAGAASRLEPELKALRALTADQPITIQIEVNNLQEVLDLLRYKIREETLQNVIRGSDDAPRRIGGVTGDGKPGAQRGGNGLGGKGVLRGRRRGLHHANDL